MRSIIRPALSLALCLFPISQFTMAAAGAAPDLSIKVARATVFIQGQINAYYLIRSVNAGSAPTAGPITVTESLPTGLAMTSMSGPGWLCQLNTCTRSDVFAAGQMLPAIRVLVSVAPNAPTMVSNSATISGGGDSDPTNNTGSDLTPINFGGYPMNWGDRLAINSRVPYNVSDVVAVTTGDRHALALQKDGNLLLWNYGGQLQSITASSQTGAVSIAAGRDASYVLKSDGTVAAWGLSSPDPVVPATLSNIVAIAAAGDHCLALKADGTVTGFGSTTRGELGVPANLTGVIGISTTVGQVIALKWDGSVVTWGETAPAIPGNLPKLVRVTSVGAGTMAGIRTDGTVTAWNAQGGGLAAVPANLNHVVDLAGDGYVLAIKDDGTVVAWGDDTYGQVSRAPQLAHVVAAMGASTHALAILSTSLVNVTVDSKLFGKGGPISTSYEAPAVMFDGVPCGATCSIAVIPGTRHEISTTATQTFPPFIRHFFTGWNIGGSMTQTVYPTADVTYSAAFRTQFQLATTASSGGAITPGSQFLDAGTEVLVRATPQAGYQFSGFTLGLGSEGNNPLRVTMDAPWDITANFVQPSSAVMVVSLQQARPLVQGQQNAEFVARIVNTGAAAVNGVTVQAQGMGVTIARTWGSGWICVGALCTRTDALPPGGQYPALVLIAAVDANATSAKVWVSVTPSGSSQAKAASVVSKVSSAGNGLVAWGDNTYTQRSVPSGLSNLVDVSAGARHSLALKGDGSMAAWGDNTKQQSVVPGGAGIVIATASGAYHNLALNRSGGVTAWGDNSSGQTTVPAAAALVVAVAAGANHSLALTSGGTVVAWGANGSGQCNVPASVVNATAIAAGGDHSLAVLSDGSVVAWGNNSAGESAVPANLSRVVAVAAGSKFSLAVQDDGAVVVWGNTPASILSGIPSGLSNVRTVAAGSGHAITLGWDGTVQSWGDNGSGQTTIPTNLLEVAAVAGGAAHSLAITAVVAPITVTLSTKVPGTVYRVDGVPFSTGHSFVWPAGSVHALAVEPVQESTTPGVRYSFSGWSDIAAPASRTLQVWSDYNLIIDMYPQYMVTTSAIGGGAITPSTGYVDAGTALTFRASPNAGYAFTGFSGDMQGLSYPRDIQLSRPISVTANFSAILTKPSLSMDVRHTSAFLRGQTNAVYLLRVSNSPLGTATSGNVQLSLNIPAGLQILSMRGPGWLCGSTSCSRSDALAGGDNYPAVLVLAQIDANAPSSLALQATVSGGGDPANHTAIDTAAVNSTAVPVGWTSPSVVATAPFPQNLTDVVSVSVGDYHFVALRKDGTVVAWGNNDQHQCDVPQGLTGVIAVAAGGLSTFVLKSDGTVLGWGYGPAVSSVPAGVTDFVDIKNGSTTAVGVKADGTIQYWGSGIEIHTVMAGRARNVVEVAIRYWSMALTADGSLLTLNVDYRSMPPAGTPKGVTISTFGGTEAALTSDGTMVNWSETGLQTWPNWTNLIRFDLGGYCSVGQKQTGSVVAICSDDALTRLRPQDLTNVTAIASGGAGATVLTSTLPTVTYQLKSAVGGVRVDGVAYPSGQTFDWTYGSSHVISVDSPTAGSNGQRSAFLMWTDNGAITHTVTASTLSPNVIEAYFTDQYYLTTSATTGGTITPPSGWYNKSYIQVVAKADPGYVFKDFSGILAGSSPTTSFYLYQPSSITAYFEPNGKAPVLSVTSTHIGDFTQGQQDSYYTVVVRNATGAGPTSGTVTVTDTLPAGLAAVSMGGSGWTCTTPTSCTRGDALAAGASYQPIIVKATVSSNATSPQVNQVTVSGGGSATANGSDSTNILTLVTLVTNPPGLNVIADGVSYTAPKSLGWAAGSSHTLNVPSPQGSGGARRVFTGWSDSGAQTHSVTAGTSPVTLTANFKAQYFLTTSVLPAGAGSILITPSSADGWFDEGQTLQVTANPAYSYSFASFTNGLSGAVNPQSMTMSSAKTVVANFAAIDPHPSAVGVSPASGSGSPASLIADYSAGLGYQNLAWVQLLVAAAPDGGGQPFCFIHFDVQGDSFWVYGDGGFFVGPVKRGTPSALLQNSFCGFNTKTSTVTGNGTGLSLKADILFKAAAARNIYLRAYTVGELDTGWQLKGTWATSAAVPGGMNSLPNSGSGAQQTFAATYTDPAGFEGAPLGWMQFLVAKATDGGGQPFCFVHYDRAGNGLWMYSSDVGFFLGPVAPGTASNALDSSACSINTGTASASSQAGVLTLSVPVTLKTPMVGSKDLYQRMLDPLNRDSGWVKTGAWTIP
ncbi:InlB B-repeat-containing protein [Paludibaculum fermentans]|uniref:DUF11 domain-containing protein n=1 Tax=Paludibaculum fermentans TaxID=1473598 RepID=A0A7S7NN98_PALFE|nr:DUF11 domain-containing protein [Paludibaculum fermentans]QOY86264.1 hypothetical protein IRI77_26110 [Paludibaculum fermentans]